jgi:hypothetical protein
MAARFNAVETRSAGAIALAFHIGAEGFQADAQIALVNIFR